MSLLKTANKGIPLLPPVYGTLNENLLLRARKNLEGYRFTVYCHGIPLSGKTYDVVLHFVLVLEDVCSFS